MEPVSKPKEVRSPAIDCPNCGAFVYLADDWCWRCMRLFKEGELRTRWENSEHHP